MNLEIFQAKKKAMQVLQEFADLQNQVGDIPVEIYDKFIKLDFDAQMKFINRVLHITFLQQTPLPPPYQIVFFFIPKQGDEVLERAPHVQ